MLSSCNICSKQMQSTGLKTKEFVSEQIQRDVQCCAPMETIATPVKRGLSDVLKEMDKMENKNAYCAVCRPTVPELSIKQSRVQTPLNEEIWFRISAPTLPMANSAATMSTPTL